MVRLPVLVGIYPLLHGSVKFWSPRLQTQLHTEKYFLNLVKLNQIWTVFTIFRLIWHQKDVRLVPN